MGDDPGDETPEGGQADGQADGLRESAEFRAPLDGDEWKDAANPVTRPLLPPAVPPAVPPRDTAEPQPDPRGWFLAEGADVPDTHFDRARIAREKRIHDAQAAARRMREEIDRRMRDGTA